MNAWADIALRVIGLGCPGLTSYPLERAMTVLGYLGYGVADVAVALVALAYGALARDRRTRTAGFAALLAVLVAGLAANLLKLAFRVPRPVESLGYGFPSGHTSTVFALAGTFAEAFPAAAPFLYLLALVGGVARLYERSHFVIDVLGGALVGTATAMLIGRKVLGPLRGGRRSRAGRWPWALPLAFGALALGYFAVYERALAAHRPSPADPHDRLLAVAFGTPEAHPYLVQGWAAAEHRAETFPRVWARGGESALRLPPLAPSAGYRIRLRVRPYVQQGGGALCQVMTVSLNGAPAGRLLLERDWSNYELQVTRDRVGAGPVEMRFRFASARGPDPSAPHAAFASLEVLAERTPE